MKNRSIASKSRINKRKNHLAHKLISYRINILCILTLATFTLSQHALAVEYKGIRGGQMVVKTVSGALSGGTKTDSVRMNYYQPRAVFGGLIPRADNVNSECALESEVVTKDGRRGLDLGTGGKVLVGVTGEVTNVVMKFCNTSGCTNATQTKTVRGGVKFNDFGYVSTVGDANTSGVSRLCGSMTEIWPGSTYYTGANNSAWGNKVGIFNGYMWIYIPQSTPTGKYTLTAAGFVQGAANASGYNNYLPVVLQGDTVNVVNPPCTVNTETDIKFNPALSGGDTHQTTLDLNCGGTLTPNPSIYVVANPISGTVKDTNKLGLEYPDGSTGPMVRGFAGVNATTNAGCVDNSSSIPFDGTLGPNLGKTPSGVVSFPLVWKLCATGNEKPGLAKGSLALDISYK